jgi:hypothetical protein
MGMDQTVRFQNKPVPSYAQVQALLARHGVALQMRMIDGELAFPDEQPPQEWKELRLGTPAGMITVRRKGDQVQLVIWGNADQALRGSWNALTWAFAEAGTGQVLSPTGPLEAAQFLRQAELPPAWGVS